MSASKCGTFTADKFNAADLKRITLHLLTSIIKPAFDKTHATGGRCGCRPLGCNLHRYRNYYFSFPGAVKTQWGLLLEKLLLVLLWCAVSLTTWPPKTFTAFLLTACSFMGRNDHVALQGVNFYCPTKTIFPKRIRHR